MAVYTRSGGGSNLPAAQPSQTTALASKDIGSIIIQSLETVRDSLAREDVPVSYKDVEKAVTVGINKSDLVKKGAGGLTAGGRADAALAAKYEQDKFIKWQEYQNKLQKEEERNRKAKEQEEKKEFDNLRANVEKTFNSVVTSLDNPLKTVSNLIDKTVKDFSTGFVAGFKDARGKGGNEIEKEQRTSGTVEAISRSPEIQSISTTMTDLNDLIKDNFETMNDQQVEMNDNLSELITDNDEEGKEREEDKTKQAAENEEEKKDRKKNMNNTEKIGYVMGQAVGKVATVALLTVAGLAVLSQIIVFLKGKLAQFIADSPVKWDARIAKIKAWFGTVGDKAKLFVNTTLSKAKLSIDKTLSKIRILGKPIFGQLSADEKKELKSLEKDKDIKAYEKAMKGVTTVDKALNTKASQLGAGSVNAGDYDLDTEEGRTAYKQAILSAANKTRAENGMPELTEAYLDSDMKKWFAERDIAMADAQKKVASLNISEEKLANYLDLKERSQTSFGPEYWAQREAEIDAEVSAGEDAIKEKRKGLVTSELEKALIKRAEAGTLTAYQAAQYERDYGIDTKAVLAKWQTETDSVWTPAPETNAEHYLQNEYKEWMDSWKNFGNNMKLDLNIDTSKAKNPTSTNK